LFLFCHNAHSLNTFEEERSSTMDGVRGIVKESSKMDRVLDTSENPIPLIRQSCFRPTRSITRKRNAAAFLIHPSRASEAPRLS
jgi:hypothetical protein